MAIGASKLTKEDVINIKELISLGLKDKEIAEQFNVSRTHVANIKLGYRWNDLKKSYVMKSEIPKNVLNLIVDSLLQRKGDNTSTQSISFNTEDLTHEINDNGNDYTIPLADGKNINIKINIC